MLEQNAISFFFVKIVKWKKNSVDRCNIRVLTMSTQRGQKHSSSFEIPVLPDILRRDLVFGQGRRFPSSRISLVETQGLDSLYIRLVA
jgi:hypothetical protein